MFRFHRGSALKRRYGRSSGGGFPPEELNVLDRHGGFTEVTVPRSWASAIRAAGPLLRKSTEHRSGITGNTLWRPGGLLKKGTIGRLIDFATNSFYQMNNDVTVALYKVPGYAHPVAVWFDNATKERIA